jgi:heterodisulfide reductase subunit A
MCSGRVDEDFVWHAFEKGAPLVLVSGCHFSDCHYISAVTWTQQRVEKIWTQMEKLGIRPERLQLDWISAAEGQKFARVMRQMDELLKQITPDEVEETKRVVAKFLKEKREKLEKRLAKSAGGETTGATVAAAAQEEG